TSPASVYATLPQFSHRSLRSFDEDDIRFVPGPIEEHLAAVRRHIEIPDRETTAKRRELPLAPRLEIVHPELLVRHISLHRHHRVASAEKHHVARSAAQDEVRHR